jgi:hypothetical protein
MVQRRKTQRVFPDMNAGGGLVGEHPRQPVPCGRALRRRVLLRTAVFLAHPFPEIAGFFK